MLMHGSHQLPINRVPGHGWTVCSELPKLLIIYPPRIARILTVEVRYAGGIRKHCGGLRGQKQYVSFAIFQE
jgi:hypothetical protein